MCSASLRYITSPKLENFHQARNVNYGSNKGGASGCSCTKATENLSPCCQYFIEADSRRNVSACTPSASRLALPCNVYSICRKTRVGLSCRFYNYRAAFCFDEVSSSSIVDHEGSRVIHKFNKTRARLPWFTRQFGMLVRRSKYWSNCRGRSCMFHETL